MISLVELAARIGTATVGSKAIRKKLGKKLDALKTWVDRAARTKNRALLLVLDGDQ